MVVFVSTSENRARNGDFDIFRGDMNRGGVRLGRTEEGSVDDWMDSVLGGEIKAVSVDERGSDDAEGADIFGGEFLGAKQER